MRFHDLAKTTGVMLAALVALPAVAHAQAQSHAEPATALPSGDQAMPNSADIIVTALKRETTAESTPIAITAVSGNALKAMGIVDSESLQRISPGLTIRESPVTGSRVSIRNIRSSGEPTVDLYYDEAPIIGSAGVTADAGGTTPNIRLFDVDHVEVLRGPQGTLYDSSSEAGTIRLIFNKPAADKVALDFDGKMFGVDRGTLGFETQGMVNIPIVTDKIAVRAVGFYQDLPGFIDNTYFGRSHVNKSTSKGGRGQIRLTPVDGLTIDGFAAVQDTHGQLNDYNLNVGLYKRNYESQEPTSDHFEIYSGTINYAVGPVVLTAVGSHSYRDFDYAYDTSAFDRYVSGIYGGAATPTGRAFASLAPSVAESPQTTKTDTGEARFTTSGTGPLQLTGGFFYSDRTGAYISDIRRTSTTDGSVLPLSTVDLEGQRVIADELKQTAEYGEATLNVTSRFAITGGVRHYHYTREVAGRVTVPNALLSLAAGPATDLTSSESGWLYKGNASFKLADHALVYATVSTGQRPGGVNQTVGLPAALLTYGSDKVRNYEVGFKGELFDRRLILNVDVFQIDWDNIQTIGNVPGTPFDFIANANASTARARGVEADATWRVVEGLTAQISGSYINAHLTADQSNPGLTAPGKNGDPIPQAPRATLQPNIQYSWPVGSVLKATLRADGYYQSSSWINFPHLNALYERLPAYATLALRAGVASIKDGWSASVYANNVTNNAAAVAKLGNSTVVYGNQPRAISLTPRTVGIELTKHF